VYKNRPVNLQLSTIKFPVTAIVSILHRISGIILLFGVLVLLWMLDASLRSEESFQSLVDTLGHPLIQLVVWVVLAALAYHMVAGLRHLVMDMNIGESLAAGRMTARATLIISGILIIAAGVWLLW
jgi:succinate dehydrogenase / fumarate reductase cytochrome b subunit